MISISPPESFTFKERNYREGEEKESRQDEPQGLVHQLSWKSFVCFLLGVKVDCKHLRQGCDCKNVFESMSNHNERYMHTENDNRMHFTCCTNI